jgi:hypothetical protein
VNSDFFVISKPRDSGNSNNAVLGSICALNIFDGQMYIRPVYQPILDALGVKRSELRRLSPAKR